MMKDSFGTIQREKIFKSSIDQNCFPLLEKAVSSHIKSFNSLLGDEGILNKAVKNIRTVNVYSSFDENTKPDKISFRVEEVQVGKPYVSQNDKISLNKKIFPSECRERSITYRARMILKVVWTVNDGEKQIEYREAGQLPIMLKSVRCHLDNLKPSELVEKREEPVELGGYFIVNGIEKLIRMLIVQRRNHPLGLIRKLFKNKGVSYSEFGILIRCVREDQTSQTVFLHYLTTGEIFFRFSLMKNEYLVPVMFILKSLINTNDREIFSGIVGCETSNSFLTDRLELLIKFHTKYGLITKDETLSYLGEKFGILFDSNIHEDNKDIGNAFLKKVVLVHLDNNRDKFNLLLFMIRKLYILVSGDCAPDNPDSIQFQEILLGGHLYGMIIKEKIEDYLIGIKSQLYFDIKKSGTVNFHNRAYILKIFKRLNENIGQKLQYFLSTGNLVSKDGLDLQQMSGYTVVAEKINFYRFISHFRMIHRGSFFAELKTTSIRKLLPESWGFLCPVHTPDGTPCGLLNHLSYNCSITVDDSNPEVVHKLLTFLGVLPPYSFSTQPDLCCVQLDGKIIGWTTYDNAKYVSDSLRYWKVESINNLSLDVEIGFVPKLTKGQYPGLFIFTTPSRFLRPVKYLPTNKIDLIGSFEQVYMNISLSHKEAISGIHLHSEISPINILSILANLTPFSDFNQSPRNMYQCQMSKQAMGTPGTALVYRSDNKLYKLESVQTPLVKSKLYDEYGLDNFPNGLNTVVAVISYTGYDMDDAMIISKSSDERGYGNGTVYKVDKIDLSFKKKRGQDITQRFGFGDDLWPKSWLNTLDKDGFPIIGVKVRFGDPIIAYYDETSCKTRIKTYSSNEDAYIQEVKLLGEDNNDSICQQVSIKYRISRKPNIGDKFSSRHGQKGICSKKWPQVDMPYTESGIQPDIIINPHAFPSRMTIGMFIESLAGKVAALNGVAQDSTTWTYGEDNVPADYFGEYLIKSGYNFHGNEPMYSGITGKELQADIYIGCVYYQRLRHMVNDKFQVRSTGPVNPLTMQPVKGRKKSGGIRFGEMEKDALIGHGALFLIQDRLLNCSDYTLAYICRKCGSILSVQRSISKIGSNSKMKCRNCSRSFQQNDNKNTISNDSNVWEDAQKVKYIGSDDITVVSIPFVLKYLDSELSAIGIKLKFNVSP